MTDAPCIHDVLPHSGRGVWLGREPLATAPLFRSPIGVEIPNEEVRSYEEALEEGQPFVMVRSEDRHPEATDLLYRCGKTYMAAYLVAACSR